VPRKPGQHLSIGINPRLRAPDPPPTKTGPTAIHPGDGPSLSLAATPDVEVAQRCVHRWVSPNRAR